MTTNPPESRPAGELAPRAGRSVWWLLVLGLAAIGLAARVVPLAGTGDRVVQQFPTEDGYLSLQIARNMSLGNGMSVAEGTIPTNGTQPFVTWLWSLGFDAVDADKASGVFVVQILELLIAVLTASMVFVVGRRLLRATGHGPAAALLAASAWFASPMGVPHTMNCLETGMYALATLVVVAVLQRVGRPTGDWGWPRSAVMGVVLGWVFWVRNDAAFLIAAVCLTHWLVGARRAGSLLGKPLGESVVMGAISVLVAVPWLHYNMTTFGHLMPISGVSEAHGASFGHNAALIGPILTELATVVVPIPESLLTSPVVVAGSSIGVALFLLVAVRWCRRHGIASRPDVLVPLIFGALLVAYYGLYFGAPWFVSRYFYPLAPFFAFATASLAVNAWGRLQGSGAGRFVAPAAALAVVGVVAGLHVRAYRIGETHQHFQVVEWVDENVPDDVWIAAIQTGTLGFWHDRTLNLDGKVDPRSLEAKLADRLPQYTVETDAEYLADWAGLRDWLEEPEIAAHFELIVHDEEANLAVLRRLP